MGYKNNSWNGPGPVAGSGQILFFLCVCDVRVSEKNCEDVAALGFRQKFIQGNRTNCQPES